MKKIISIYFLILGLAFVTSATANDIYIEQIGDTLDLDITQDGTGNEFGDSTADAELTGDAMTFAITQTGNLNKIDAKIDGNDYTGTWVFTGNNNEVDLTCDSTSGVNCENVTLNITTTGNSNLFDIYIGESADSEDLVGNFTITGDGSVIQTEVNGKNADITVTMNNSSSTSSTVTTDATTGNATAAGGNLLDITVTGDGSTNGHKIVLDVTGGGNALVIGQSGINDNTVDLKMTGDDGTVNITQSD